jgi:hypothetical protein
MNPADPVAEGDDEKDGQNDVEKYHRCLPKGSKIPVRKRPAGSLHL